VYILSSLPTPPDVLKKINSILYDFLWDGKGDKIRRTTMINSYAKGGLKMLYIQSFNESLKMKWIQGYLTEENKGKWKLFFDHYLRYPGFQRILFFLSILLVRGEAGLTRKKITSGHRSTQPHFHVGSQFRI